MNDMVRQSVEQPTPSSRRNFMVQGLGLLAVSSLAIARSATGAVAKKPLPPFDLSFVGDKLTLYRRKVWTDEKAKAWMLREGGIYDRITVHHQGGSICTARDKDEVAAEINVVYAGHKQKKYADIAYHFIIDYAGSIWEGRSLAYEGAHVMNQNKNNIGILFLGNYQKQNPSQDSLTTLKNFITVLRKRFGIKHHRIYGHRDLGQTLCPGKNLYPHVVAIREGKA